MIEGRDFCVRLTKLPISVHGVTVRDNTGFYNIYININQSSENQKKAVEHELAHIEQGDFDKADQPLEAVENYY